MLENKTYIHNINLGMRSKSVRTNILTAFNQIFLQRYFYKIMLIIFSIEPKTPPQKKIKRKEAKKKTTFEDDKNDNSFDMDH